MAERSAEEIPGDRKQKKISQGASVRRLTAKDYKTNQSLRGDYESAFLRNEVIAYGEEYAHDVELRGLLMAGIMIVIGCMGMWDFRMRGDDKSGGKTIRRRRNKRTI